MLKLDSVLLLDVDCSNSYDMRVDHIENTKDASVIWEVINKIKEEEFRK